MKKSGLSAVITTVIMIALVLVAVGIVWAVMSNLIGGNLKGIEAGAVMIDLDLKSVMVDESNTVFVAVKRGIGKGDLTQIKFILSNGTDEIIYKKDTNLRESKIKIFNFSLPSDFGELVKVSIIPIIVLKSGEEFAKDVSDEINVIKFGNNINCNNNEDCEEEEQCIESICIIVCPDDDNDGYESSSCGGNDCDDTNASINPDATEICGNDIDEDCDGGDASCGGDDIINAASCDQGDVQAAVNSASDGDTVLVPAGECEWNSNIRIEKNIEIIGAGAGETVITISGSNIEAFRVYDGQAGGSYTFRISGFEFNGNSRANHAIDIHETSIGFRIDNNKFVDCGSRTIEFGPNSVRVEGLIDNNEFIDSSSTAIVIQGDRTASWERGETYGTDQSVFIEDNIFIWNTAGVGEHAISSNSGGRYVFRYNTLNVNTNAVDAPIDVHGRCFQDNRGGFGAEIYENTINVAVNGVYRAMFLRGGNCIVYENNIITAGNADYVDRPIDLTNYLSFYGSCDNDHSLCDDSGGADYPCQDQIQNTYLWDNIYRGSTEYPSVMSDGYVPIYIQKDRDYWDDSKISTGISKGSSCTTGNVYWETDNKILYRCISNNWEEQYRAYTYPHPLNK
jgi:hypothetical protein